MDVDGYVGMGENLSNRHDTDRLAVHTCHGPSTRSSNMKQHTCQPITNSMRCVSKWRNLVKVEGVVYRGCVRGCRC